MHQILTSEIPFLDSDQDALLSDFDSVPPAEEFTLDMGLIVDYCRGKQPFPTFDLIMHGVGKSAIDFVKSVMAPLPGDRLTAENALQSEWIVENTPRLEFSSCDFVHFVGQCINNT